MTISGTQQLRNAEILYRAIAAFEPTNEIEQETRRLLLDLVRVRRTELRRELVKTWIRHTGRVA